MSRGKYPRTYHPSRPFNLSGSVVWGNDIQGNQPLFLLSTETIVVTFMPRFLKSWRQRLQIEANKYVRLMILLLLIW